MQNKSIYSRHGNNLEVLGLECLKTYYFTVPMQESIFRYLLFYFTKYLKVTCFEIYIVMYFLLAFQMFP